jgi:hypothetical protein
LGDEDFTVGSPNSRDQNRMVLGFQQYIGLWKFSTPNEAARWAEMFVFFAVFRDPAAGSVVGESAPIC